MFLQDYVDQYVARTQKSEAVWNDAKTMLPGGVAGGAGFLAPRPMYVERAQGGRFYDLDGNAYIDLLLGGGPHILGHSPECVVAAVRRQLERGTSYMLFNEMGVELAKLIRKHQPHVEMIRFANTGSEATMFALRVARSFTKREKIAKPEGGYHGQHDTVLVSGTHSTAGPERRPEGSPESAGMPSDVPGRTVIFPWNDADATVAIVEEHAAELAAVILEPMPGFGMGMAFYFAALGAGRVTYPAAAGVARITLAVGGGWLLGDVLGLGLTGQFIAVALGITAYGALCAAAVRPGVWPGPAR